MCDQRESHRFEIYLGISLALPSTSHYYVIISTVGFDSTLQHKLILPKTALGHPKVRFRREIPRGLSTYMAVVIVLLVGAPRAGQRKARADCENRLLCGLG